MSDIPLHPDRGLDPHLTFCQRCGGEAEALTIGHVVKYRTPDGRILIAQAGQAGAAARQAGINIHDCTKEEIKEGERLPSPEPCKKCKTEMRLHESEVAAGGVYFRCEECGQHGVIKASGFADAVRESAGVPAPDPIGVTFAECEQHGGEKLAANNIDEQEKEDETD